MGMIYMDSFSGYGTPQVGLRFTGALGGNVTIDPGGGRHGNDALASFGSFGPIFILKNPTANLIIGMAIRADAGNPNQVFIEASPDNIDADSSRAGQIAMDNGTQGFRVTAGSTGVNTATNLWFGGVYFHIQMRIQTTWAGGVMSSTVTVKFNNVTVATISGTTATASNKIKTLRFPWLVADTIRRSDFYLIDMDDGIAPTDFISPTGDLDISPLFPDNVGVLTEFSPDPAHPTTPNWQLVNEHPPDGDASYVFSPTVGARDLYHFPGASTIVPAGSTVYGVQENCYAKKDDPAGSRSFCPLTHIASNNTNYQGDTAALGNDYAYYYNCMGFNFATGNPWQIAEVGGSGSQFGHKVIS